jgi:hypothetical protein
MNIPGITAFIFSTDFNGFESKMFVYCAIETANVLSLTVTHILQLEIQIYKKFKYMSFYILQFVIFQNNFKKCIT